MNQQDRLFMRQFSMVLGVLVVIAIVIFILAGTIADDVIDVSERDKQLLTASTARIQPVGQVVIEGSEQAQAEQAQATATTEQASQQAASAPSMSGEEVYNSACLACHDAGVGGAPKTGDQDIWDKRYQQGLDTLVDHAINGFQGEAAMAMPPKGNRPDLSDDNVRAAVIYMLQQSGQQVEAAASAASSNEDNNEETASAEQTDSASSEQISTAAATNEETATQTAATSTEQSAPQTQATASTETENETDTQTQTAVASTEQPAEQAQATETTSASETSTNIPADVDLSQGQQVYTTACVICHQQGVANAPKLADKEAWQPRLEQGWDMLVEHAIKGFKGMPAKGGRMDIPDDQIIHAVGYMVSESQ